MPDHTVDAVTSEISEVAHNYGIDPDVVAWEWWTRDFMDRQELMWVQRYTRKIKID